MQTEIVDKSTWSLPWCIRSTALSRR